MREGEIEYLIEADSEVLALRVFVGQRPALVYSSDLDPDALRGLAEQAVELAALSDPDPCVGVPDDGPFVNGVDGTALELHDPAVFAQDSQTLIKFARRAESAARGYDPKITNSRGAIFARRQRTIALANSRGFADSYRAGSCSLSASAIAADEGNKRRMGWWSTAGRSLA